MIKVYVVDASNNYEAEGVDEGGFRRGDMSDNLLKNDQTSLRLNRGC